MLSLVPNPFLQRVYTYCTVRPRLFGLMQRKCQTRRVFNKNRIWFLLKHSIKTTSLISRTIDPVSGVFIYGPASPCGFSSPCPQESNASGIMQYVDPKAPSNYVDAVQSEGQSTDACPGHGGREATITIDNIYYLCYHIHSGLGINTTAQRVACGLPPDTPGNH